MAQTKEGAKKAVFSIKERHGEDFYKIIGAKGGVKGAEHGVIKGFALDRQRAIEAGKIGGKISKRGKSTK